MSKKVIGEGRLILLAVAPFLLSLCSRTEELQPDTSPSDQKTVTITIRSSESLAGPGTRTTLEDDGRVIWNEGDRVYINNRDYEVIPNPDDPTMATVEGVAESDEYVAFGNRGGYYNGEYCVLNFYSYNSYSGSRQDMPMMAYSTDTNLEFKNIGGVVRLAVTGTQTLARISLATDTPIGSVRVPMEDFKTGNIKDSYADMEYSGSNFTSIEFDYEGEDFLTLNPSQPEYFYFCLPAQVYETGFTAIVSDIDGKLAVKKVSSPVEVLRSTLVPMAPFEFEPIQDPVITLTETTDSSFTFTVKAEPGMPVQAGAVYSSLYEQLPESTSYFDEEYTQASYAAEAVYNSPAEVLEKGEDGTYTFRIARAYNYDGEYMKMTAGTDYHIVAAYAGWDEVLSIPVALEASTEAAAGEGPEFTVEVDTDSSTYTNLVLQIASSEEIEDLSIAILPQNEYEEYTSAGMTDMDIAQVFGMILPSEKAEEASMPEGLAYGSTEIRSCLLYPSADFTAVVLATGHDRVASVRKVTYTTPEHFPQETVWETVSASAELNFSFYHYDDATGSNYSSTAYFSGLTFEKSTEADIYRIGYNPDENQDFVKTMSDLRLVSEEAGQTWLYLDVTEYDLTDNPGRYIIRAFPEESYSGFRTAGMQQAYFTTQGWSTSLWPDYSSDYVSIYLSTQLTTDHEDEENEILGASISISYFLSGSTAGIYAESFHVSDRTPW